MSPAVSCDAPSCGEIEVVDGGTNASGTAPYLSTLVSEVAWACVKPAVPGPVISPLPVGIGPLTCGAEITLPSSTIANWSRTEVSLPVAVLKYFWYICDVRSPKA